MSGYWQMSDQQLREKYGDTLDAVARFATDINDELFNPSDLGDGYAAIYLARYLVWLGGQGGQVDAQKLAAMAYAMIADGRYPSEVAEDFGLPIPPDWEAAVDENAEDDDEEGDEDDEAAEIDEEGVSLPPLTMGQWVRFTGGPHAGGEGVVYQLPNQAVAHRVTWYGVRLDGGAFAGGFRAWLEVPPDSPERRFTIGQRVRLTDGPMTGSIGTVVSLPAPVGENAGWYGVHLDGVNGSVTDYLVRDILEPLLDQPAAEAK